jgi:hypothetical protein
MQEFAPLHKDGSQYTAEFLRIPEAPTMLAAVTPQVVLADRMELVGCAASMAFWPRPRKAGGFPPRKRRKNVDQPPPQPGTTRDAGNPGDETGVGGEDEEVEEEERLLRGLADEDPHMEDVEDDWIDDLEAALGLLQQEPAPAADCSTPAPPVDAASDHGGEEVSPAPMGGASSEAQPSAPGAEAGPGPAHPQPRPSAPEDADEPSAKRARVWRPG